jgi:hypothetical protein
VQTQRADVTRLAQETKFLQTIDRLKTGATAVNKDERIKRQLEIARSVRSAVVRVADSGAQMAAPKKWAMQDGGVSDVHTPYTTRAHELLELYEVRIPGPVMRCCRRR